MKRAFFIVLAFAVFATGNLRSQKELPKKWESKFSVNPEWNAYAEDLSLILGGDLAEIEMLDGETGKSLWVCNFREKFGVKKCEDWFFLTDQSVVKVIYKAPKSDSETVEYLDARTGQTISETSLPEKKKERGNSASRTRERFVFQDYLLEESSSTAIMLGYDDKKLKNAMGGTEMTIRVSASGGYNWNSSFEGKIVTHLCYEFLNSTVVLNMFVAEGKIFIVHEGITVLDLASGKVLWQTTFDYTDTDIGLKAKQEIGRSAWPVVTKDAVYICDLSKGEKAIKKLDIQTGQVIWTGAKLSKSDIISSLSFEGGNLIVKYGGVILVEEFIPSSSGGPGDGTYKVSYQYEGTSSIAAYDPSNGALKWSTDTWDNGDNFKKSPCNLMVMDHKLFYCSDKLFYRIDPATGQAEVKTAFGAKEIGKPQYMYVYGDKIIIEGEEGIAAVDAQGKLIYSVNTGKCIMTEWRGEAFIVWTGKAEDDRNEFISFDLNTGTIYGKMEDCYRPRFDTSGSSFLYFQDEKVTRYLTR